MDTTQRPHRTLHLIDVENLSGTGTPAQHELAAGQHRYAALGLVAPADHIVVASNPFVAVEVGMVWPGARLRVAHGADGADLALVEVLETERVEVRYDGVVIASGDGIFVDALVALQTADVPVTVVSRRSALSKRLRMAATRVFFLDEPPFPAPALAMEVA